MKNLYDAVIVGGGPAGLTAAIYMARAQYRVLVVEKEKIGGQITITSEVVNYPGIALTDGKKLTESMRLQAESFGAEFLAAKVNDLQLDQDIRIVKTSKGDIETLGVILATGASPRVIGFPGEREFQGRGVAYCATCDGEFFTGLPVLVVGGGFAAAEEALFLTKYASKVSVLVRKDQFSCAGSIVDEVMAHPDIEVFFNTEISETGGAENLQYAILQNNKTGATRRFEAETGKTFGIFVFAGYEPATDLFKGKVALTDGGYLITDRNQKTSVDGVYGAGDVCEKELRQVVTAVSDGAVAGTSLEKYISQMYAKLLLPKREKIQKKEIKSQPDAAHSLSSSEPDDSGGFITETMKAQLAPIFARFEKHLILKGYVSDDKAGAEITSFLDEFNALTDKVAIEIHKKSQMDDSSVLYPAIKICDAGGQYLGVQFHAVPGGHEFNSFVIALYNAAGPGQALDETDRNRIQAISEPLSIHVVVSLSCTMCPELVMASQRIALENPLVEAEMFDLALFPELKEKYNIMSVPCFIIKKGNREEKVQFGKKTIAELLTIFESL